MTSSKMQVSRNRIGQPFARNCASAEEMLGMTSSTLAAFSEGKQLPAVRILHRQLVCHFRRPLIDLDQPALEQRGVQHTCVSVSCEDEVVPPFSVLRMRGTRS